MGILWADWLSQPPEHRALYLQVEEDERQMDAYDEAEERKAAAQ